MAKKVKGLTEKEVRLVKTMKTSSSITRSNTDIKFRATTFKTKKGGAYDRNQQRKATLQLKSDY